MMRQVNELPRGVRVIESGTRRETPSYRSAYLSAAELKEILTALSTPQRRALLARLRAALPMHTRDEAAYAFLRLLSKWIEAQARID